MTMLSDKEIYKLTQVLATKEDIQELNSRIADLKQKFRLTTNIVNNLIKVINNLSN